MQPPITVVVPTHNRPRRLRRAVAAILANEYPIFELVIIDQSTIDKSSGSLSELSDCIRVRRIEAPPAGVAAARNLGITEATYDLIAMTDDDCLPPTDWLKNLAQAFAAEPCSKVVFGNVEAVPFDPERGFVPTYVREESFVARSLADKPQAEGISACMGIRREIWRQLGGFDERFGIGSVIGAGAEIDFTMRALAAGAQVYETPEVVLMHDGFRTWDEAKTLVSRYWWGAGAVYGLHFRQRPLKVLRICIEMAAGRPTGRSRVAASLQNKSFLGRRVFYFTAGLARGMFLSAHNEPPKEIQ